MYSSEILLNMLDTAIGGLIENDICSYCQLVHSKDERCINGENCKTFIFLGLLDRHKKTRDLLKSYEAN